MQGTQIWNIPTITTLPLRESKDRGSPWIDVKEKLGALSPWPGTPANNGLVRNNKRIKKVKALSGSLKCSLLPFLADVSETIGE